MQMASRKYQSFEMDCQFFRDYQLQSGRWRCRGSTSSLTREVAFLSDTNRSVSFYSPTMRTPPKWNPQPAVSDGGANQYPWVLTFAVAERHLKLRQLELDFVPRNSHKSWGGAARISRRLVKFIKLSAIYWERGRI